MGEDNKLYVLLKVLIIDNSAIFSMYHYHYKSSSCESNTDTCSMYTYTSVYELYHDNI